MFNRFHFRRTDGQFVGPRGISSFLKAILHAVLVYAPGPCMPPRLQPRIVKLTVVRL